MLDIKEYGQYETAWCPGCGNFVLLKSLKQALAQSDLHPHQILFVSGIGQAAKAPHYLNANVFNGLHGRSLPVATAAKLANRDLVVIAESGDGCMYGEGGNHFLAALRRNLDITILVHDNQIYGLTKGQASPTSLEGFTTKAQPHGTPSGPFNPVETAIAMGCGFVARGFTGNKDHLADLIAAAIKHKGTSLVDIFQPCVSFNKVNTFSWYKDHCYDLSDDYDPTDQDQALRKAREFGDRIPLGILYKNPDKEIYWEHFPEFEGTSLISKDFNHDAFEQVLDKYRI